MTTRLACARFPLVALLLCAAPAFAAEPCAPKSDFLVRSDPTLAPVRPADCTTVAQSPPEFTWPPQKGRNTYEVTLTFPDGQKQSRRTPHNWLLWNEPIPAGRYTWRVKVSGESNYTSDARTFTVSKDAVPFVVPAPEAMVKQAAAAPRPRTWSRDPTRPIAAVKSERAAGFRALAAEVDNKRPAPVQPEPVSTSDGQNYGDVVAEHKRTIAAAFAWAATREERFGHDAVRRLLAQARWSADGPLSYKRNDMASRTIAWTLALGYDWTHDRLDAAEKKAILAAIRARTQPMFEDVTSRLGGYPYDSHANVALIITAAIGALTVGDIPEAERWLAEAGPLAVVWSSPWGGNDGGFGNGSQQLFWDTGENLPAWIVLRNAAGIDFPRKEWLRNLTRFMAYFVPPGAPSGVFGDGHELELSEVWSRIAKATARFAPTPLGQWYASALDGEDGSRIELMLSPRVKEARAKLPPDTPDAAYFPSVGWVAMHSRLADPKRTSVYFKSSPYGSYNHSHGDQNGFVIHHRGKRLAVASGYYDGYRTPHWMQWYKHTRAANAITFDGGKGQGFNDKGAAGDITRFGSGEGYDYAIGRAEKAYGGALTLAQRAIVYLRPGVVLVHDRLASATPRTWEWNIHALERMEHVSPHAVGIANGEAKMCLEMIAGPEAIFGQNDRFDAAPSMKDAPRQWHGRFTTIGKSREAEFVALMRVGAECKPGAQAGKPTATAKKSGDTWTVEVDGRTVRFTPDDVAVS